MREVRTHVVVQVSLATRPKPQIETDEGGHKRDSTLLVIAIYEHRTNVALEDCGNV